MTVRYNSQMDAETLGKNIKKLRQDKGLTQAALAKRLGWKSGNSRISQYELGTREPTIGDLERIAEELGTSAISMLIDPSILPPGYTAEQLGLAIIAFAREGRHTQEVMLRIVGIADPLALPRPAK